MNSKEKLIIQKLLALAEKQQKVLTKLAQGTSEEADKSYLKQTWQTAGLNAGVTEMASPTVTYTPGGPTSEPDVTSSGNYMVTGAIPVALREKFVKTFNAQIQSQRPDLDGKVSTIFKDAVNPAKPA